MSCADCLLLLLTICYNLACSRLTVRNESCYSKENEFLVAKRILKMLAQNNLGPRLRQVLLT